MKNLILKTKFATISLLMILFISCDGEDGAIGPAGVDGQDGANGQDGNANVISSAWIDADFSTSATFFTFFDFVDATNITQSTVDSSVILAYGRLSGDTSVISIPFVFSNKSYYITLIPENNAIRFVGTSVDGADEVFNNLEVVRYVIIPSNTTKSMGVDFTKMTYEEVINHFGLEP